MHTIRAFAVDYTSLKGPLLSTNTFLATSAVARAWCCVEIRFVKRQQVRACETFLTEESVLRSQHRGVSIDGVWQHGRKRNGWAKDS
jgi:hypothetical protein